MSLQTRILEALGDNPLRPHSLHRAMAGESSAGVEAALSGLLKAGIITFELGMYQRARNVSVATVTGRDRGNPVAAAAIAALRAAPKPVPAPAAAAPLATQRCKKCGEEKLLSEFQPSNLGGGIYLKTCKRCAGRKPNVAISDAAPVSTRAQEASKPQSSPSAPRKITFSSGLISRLIEQQRSLAMSVQILQDRLAMKRQDLLDIEELVRIATQKEA